MMIRTALAALALTVSSAAAAHSFWLEPQEHSLEPGQELRVDFKVGDTGEVADHWALYWERIASLRLFGPDGATDQQRAVITTTRAEPGHAVLGYLQPGSYILAFESNPSFSDLEAERFNNYVEHVGLTAIAEYRERLGLTGEAGTELYSRRAKTLLQVGNAPTTNVTVPIGQTLEIVPTVHPLSVGAGEPFQMMVLWRGEPLAGALMQVSPLDASAEIQEFTSDEHGLVTIPEQLSTATLYSVVWGVPAPNDARADFITFFSSLTVGWE